MPADRFLSNFLKLALTPYSHNTSKQMNIDYIISQEASNDGQTVFLFYDAEEGCYKAFGRSAYYADMVTNGRLYYSEELQLPVMLLSRQSVMDLRVTMTVVEHRKQEYYRLRIKAKIGDAGYERWKEKYGLLGMNSLKIV